MKIGCHLLVKWTVHSKSWVKLKDMKKSNPMNMAKYAKTRGVKEKPSFSWLVPHTMRKRNVIMSALSSRVRKGSHKCGI